MLTSTFSLQPPKACERREEPWESCSPRRGHGDSRDHSSRRPAGRPYDYHYCCFFFPSRKQEMGVHKLPRRNEKASNYPRSQGKVRAWSRVSRNLQFSPDLAQKKPSASRGPSWRRRAKREAKSSTTGQDIAIPTGEPPAGENGRGRVSLPPRDSTGRGRPTPPGLLPCELTRVGGTSPCGSASPRAR